MKKIYIDWQAAAKVISRGLHQELGEIKDKTDTVMSASYVDKIDLISVFKVYIISSHICTYFSSQEFIIQ